VALVQSTSSGANPDERTMENNQFSPRGTALARTFAAAFEALKEHSKAHQGEAVVLAGQVAAHLRSAFPMEALAVVAPTTPAADLSELAKLRDEVEAMRPVYVAAVEWISTPCSGNFNCKAGDHDGCPIRDVERKLRTLLAEVAGV
jgi:hypothetical protein